MSKNRQIKETKVVEIREELEKAQTIVLADYQGLTVEKDTALRRALREAGTEYRVYKNNLATSAAKELGIKGLDSYSGGPASMAFGYEDAIAPTGVLHTFAKDHKELELKASVVEGILYNKEEVEKLATVPSKEVLIAELLRSFKIPLSNVTCLLNVIKGKRKSESAE